MREGICDRVGLGQGIEQLQPEAAPRPAVESVVDRRRETVVGRAIAPVTAHFKMCRMLERRGPIRYLLSDKGYDGDRLRRTLLDAGTMPVIPGRRNRKRSS